MEKSTLTYLDDRSIPWYDKELQWVLDRPDTIEDPETAERDIRAEAKMLSEMITTGVQAINGQWVEFRTDCSLEDMRAMMLKQLSPVNKVLRRIRYGIYRAMVRKALSKGFVRGGNCENVRRRHGDEKASKQNNG